MKNTLLKLFIVCTCLFSDYALFAQPGNNDDDLDLEGNDPPAAPINSKLMILLVFGAVYGFYAYKNNKKTA